MKDSYHWIASRIYRIARWICILFLSVSSVAGAQQAGAHPQSELDITPGELLIRITPEAQSEFKRLHAGSALHRLNSQLGVQSFQRVFPHIARPSLHPNLERVYLLRFAVSADIYRLKSIYAENPLIEEAEFNYLRPTQAAPITPNDPRYAELWNLPMVHAPQAWAIEKGSPDVVIAIVDTGFDYTHPDLAPKVWINADEIPDNGIDDDNNGYVDDVRGWDFADMPNVSGADDFLDGDNDPIDESGHGTHVAGIAGAAVDNGIGVAGIAWNCKLMAVRSGASVDGGGTSLQDDDSAAAMVYATDNGARVINMSWGSRRSSFVIRDAVDYAYARGALLVSAAGNSTESEPIFPAGYRKVMTVASIGAQKEKFYQSNFGSSVDIAAPGEAILSTHIGDRYRNLTGTSMATPHVSGAAALVMSKRPTLTHEEVWQVLVSTVDVIMDSAELVGAGSLNVERALIASSPLQARILSPETHSGTSGEIPIFGVAGGFKFGSWRLLHGESNAPTTWRAITGLNVKQKANEILATWNTAAVPEGVYTVRLEVIGKDGNVVRDDVIISVDRTPPKVQNFKARQWIAGANFVTAITWSTDDFTTSILNQRAREGLVPFSPIEEDLASREHIFTLPLPTGTYDFFVASRNPAGLETIDDNGGHFYRAQVIGGSIPPNGYIRVNNSDVLPPMHLASVTADFDRDGRIEIVGLPLSEDDAGSGIQIYEQAPNGIYQLAHTVDIAFEPWAVDDADGDGLLEILGSTREGTRLIEAETRNGYPARMSWEFTDISSAQIADLDRDGLKEIIGANNNADRIVIYENRGNDAYEKILELINVTEGSNVFGKQFAIADFNGNGRMELMVGDSEGELFVYESIGDNQLAEIWRGKIDGRDAFQLAAGELTGDSLPDFVVGGVAEDEDLPSLAPRWKYHVFAGSPASDYMEIWSQELVPFRLRGNSVRIADVDGDARNEIIIIANPNMYVFDSDGANLARASFIPVWHHETWETPHLFLADLNQNGFSKIYFNARDNLLIFESGFAGNPNSVVNLQPWNAAATPVTERAVRVTWNAVSEAASFTVYRATGASSEPTSEFEVVASDLDRVGFLDRNVTKDITYWYSITAKNEAGVETIRTEPVSVTPRTPPRLIAAEHIGGNQLAVTYDKSMDTSIGDENRYLLRQPEQLVGVIPTSAIRDRMGRRAILSFRSTDLVPGRAYEITVSDVRDIDRNPIDLRAATQMVVIPPEAVPETPQDFSRTVVYPNPVRPNASHKGAVTFDHVPGGAIIEIFSPNGDLLDTLTVEPSDRGRKEWLLVSGGGGEVTSGVYIYAMEFGDLKKIGKFAVIK